MTVRTKQSVKVPRVWQRMLSGRRLDLANPSPMDVEVEDIAHGLARVARWNGQTKGEHAFSVAEHSVIVERICRKLDPSMTAKQSLTALLHDAPEYVIGDMISPFKALLGESYKEIEARLQEAIHIRFGLAPITPQRLKKQIKKADPASDASHGHVPAVGLCDQPPVQRLADGPQGKKWDRQQHVRRLQIH